MRELYFVRGTLVTKSYNYANYIFSEYGDTVWILDDGRNVTTRNLKEDDVLVMKFTHKFKIHHIEIDGFII
jgi:hypothetical protein